MKRPPLSRRPLSQHVQQHFASGKGVGLVELLLVAAATIAVTGAGYGLYRVTDQHQKLNLEQNHVGELTANTIQAYASTNDFSTLDQANALSSQVFPKNMLDSSGTPRSAWGGTVEVTGMPLPNPDGTTSEHGFAITYDAVPTSSCQSLVANAGPGFYDVTVQGTSVLNAAKQVNAAQSAQLCDRPNGSTVQFVYAKASDSGVGNAPELNNCVAPADRHQDIACPSGQVDSTPPYLPTGIHQQQEASCPDPYGAPNWTPWHTISNTCSPTCSTRISGPTWATKTGLSQATPCPAGQTSTSNQTGTQAATCGANPAWPVDPTWAPIVWTGGSCAPTCATRLATSAYLPNPQTSSRATPCPAGQLSTSNQSGTNTASCAAPGAAADPVWGGWVWTGGSCAPQCVAPANTTHSQGASCPGGQVTAGGAGSFTQTRSVTYSCPAPTGSYTTAYGAWSPAASSVCAPACVVPASQSQSLGCPAGQTGAILQQRDGYCPAPTGAGAYGGWYTTGNSCITPAPTCVKTTDVTIISSKLCIGNTSSVASSPAQCFSPFNQGQQYSGYVVTNFVTGSASFTFIYQGQTYTLSNSCQMSAFGSLNTCSFPTGFSLPGVPGLQVTGMGNTPGYVLGQAHVEAQLSSSCH